MPRGTIRARVFTSRFLGGNRRSRKFAKKAYKKRAKNAPVARKLRRPARSKRAKISRNKSAIVTLSRQVKTLQNKELGSVQRKYETLQIPISSQFQNETTVGTINNACKLKEPYLLCLNDFYGETEVRKADGHTVTTGATGLLQFIPAASDGSTSAIAYATRYFFEKPHLISDATGDNGMGVHASMDWNLDRNKSTVSMQQYAPVSAFYNFKLRMRYLQPGHSAYARVTVFKLKTPPMHSTIKSYNLPQSLQAYGQFAHQQPAYRNQFNSNLHQIISDKMLKFRAPDAAAVGGHTVDRVVTVPMVFNQKVYKPNMQFTGSAQHNYPGSQIEPMSAAETAVQGDTEITAGLPFNVAQNELVWCLISVDDTVAVTASTANPILQVMASRSVSWRDNDGLDTV